MNFNSVEMQKYTSEMSALFNSMEETLATLEASYKKIYGKDVWNSEARNYFFDRTKQVFQNMDAVSTKFLNTKKYLNTVIENYETLNTSLINTFRF